MSLIQFCFEFEGYPPRFTGNVPRTIFDAGMPGASGWQDDMWVASAPAACAWGHLHTHPARAARPDPPLSVALHHPREPRLHGRQEDRDEVCGKALVDGLNPFRK